MNSNVTFVVPQWGVQFAAVAFLTIFLALLTGFVVEYLKHRYTLAQGKKLAMFAVHNALVFIAALFGALSYAIPFLQTNLTALEKLPYFGAYVVGIYAASNYLYALKGKTWFKNLLNTAQKLDAKQNGVVLQSAPNIVSQVPVTPIPSEPLE